MINGIKEIHTLEKKFFFVAEKKLFSYNGKISTFFHLLIDFDFESFINKRHSNWTSPLS